MIYAGELGIQYPVKDLYDKAIMQMSIAAAKDMYEKGQKQLEDFNTKYGDFISPIAKDMELYDKNVTGKVRDTINNLYANGIDPLRSAEGRAAISQLIYSMPTGDIAKLRQSAEAAKEYIKNRGILEASGKWDPNFERFANQGNTLEDWDTGANGVWNRTSPAEFKTLKEVTEDWYNQRQAHTLDKAGVESFNMKYDPRYNYQGFTDQDLLDIAAGQTPGWNGSIYADYYRDVAKQMAVMNKIANGDNSPVTASDIEKQLQRNIATANREYLIAPTKEADQFVLDDYRTKNDIRAHAANKAVDHEYWKLEHAGDGDGNNQNQNGYSLAKDVYGTSIAKAAGVEYLPKDGMTPYDLKEMMKSGAKIQRDAIVKKGSTFDATGIFISPEKIGGLIPAVSEKDGKYILNENFINQLYELDDVRSSYGGWRQKRDKSGLASLEARQNFKNNTKTIRTQIAKKISDGKYKIEVTPISDKNGNNVYPIFGEDDVFRTYSRVRVKILDDKGNAVTGGGITAEGKEMGLKVGLHSNKGAASPDLSVSAREKLGRYPFNDTKKEIGLTGNADWPFGTNILKDKE